MLGGSFQKEDTRQRGAGAGGGARGLCSGESTHTTSRAFRQVAEENADTQP
jgi:hypothetical protein